MIVCKFLSAKSLPLPVNGAIDKYFSLPFSIITWPQGLFRTHYPGSVLNGKHIWFLVGVFKILPETQFKEKALKSPLINIIPSDAESQLSFYYFWVLRIISHPMFSCHH